MNIRKAKLADAQTISKIMCDTIKYSNSKDYTPNQIKVWLNTNNVAKVKERIKNPDKVTFIILDDNKIVGTSTLNLKERELGSLYVKHRVHSKGIGTKLLEFVENFAEKKKFEKLMLGSTLTSLGFYKNRGYKIINKKHNVVIDGIKIPTIVMSKKIIQNMPKIKNIGKIITLLKKEVKDFENPVVSKIGEIQKDPFKVLISCILSLRTQDKTTGHVALKLFEAADNPKKLADMPLKRIQKIIKPVNYYITKSNRIKEISKTLIKKYKGKVPDAFEELMKLKGVGKKTAAITMVYGHQKADYIPTDTHVHVISNRLGWVKTKNAEQTMDELMKVVPKKYWHDLNDLMVLHGQNVCITLSPFCSKCGINQYCPRIGVTRSR
ncbi:GNAT family N-acetyltransferase [Candidatus Woesearchaeota archaeon]|nr:GNAT family N-acetyltransferase [Candidatus Woesearchaeota archaeon]